MLGAYDMAKYQPPTTHELVARAGLPTASQMRQEGGGHTEFQGNPMFAEDFDEQKAESDTGNEE